jgi:hypothetical protein
VGEDALVGASCLPPLTQVLVAVAYLQLQVLPLLPVAINPLWLRFQLLTATAKLPYCLVVVLHHEVQLSDLLGVADGLQGEVMISSNTFALLEVGQGHFRLPPLTLQIGHPAQYLNLQSDVVEPRFGLGPAAFQLQFLQHLGEVAFAEQVVALIECDLPQSHVDVLEELLIHY